MPHIWLSAVPRLTTPHHRLYRASKHTLSSGSRSHLLQMEAAHLVRPSQGRIRSRSTSIFMTNTYPDQTPFRLQYPPRMTESVA